MAPASRARSGSVAGESSASRAKRSATAGQADLPVEAFATKAAWQQWLEANHVLAAGVLVKLAKKGSGFGSVTYAEAVEVALCYGWIDGQGNRIDDAYWVQRFTPRRARSKWSRRNRDKALELIEQRKMRPAGLLEVARAKEDGRWVAAYDPPSTAAVPDDLQRELNKNPKAMAFFATLDSQNRYAILYRIEDAKRPDTRKRRIEKFVAMLNDGDKIHA